VFAPSVNSGHPHFPAGDGPYQPARRRAHVVPRDSQTFDRCPSRGQRFVGITWMTKLHPSVQLSQMSRFCALDLIASRSATGKLRCATINFTQVFFAPACCLFIRMERSRTRHDHKVAQVSSPRNASRYHFSHAVRIRLGQQSDIRQTVRGWNWRATTWMETIYDPKPAFIDVRYLAHLQQLSKVGLVLDQDQLHATGRTKRWIKHWSRYFAVEKTTTTSRSIFNGNRLSEKCKGGAYPRDTPTFEALMHALQRRIKASRSLYTCRRRTHVHDQLIDSSPSW
jgi:hypothetical protein